MERDLGEREVRLGKKKVGGVVFVCSVPVCWCCVVRVCGQRVRVCVCECVVLVCVGVLAERERERLGVLGYLGD